MLYPLIQAIADRRSVRKFDVRSVEREQILTCVEAARLAPSAENAQPWRFVVIDDPLVKEAFAAKAFSGIYRPTRWVLPAPVLVVLLAEWKVVTHGIGRFLQGTPFHLIDVGIAGEHFVLQAQALGLGTCWIGWFHAGKVRRFLRLPRRMKPCGIIAVGYPHPNRRPRTRRRKSLDEIVSFNGWEETEKKQRTGRKRA